MNPQMQKLLEYEKKLLENRKELQKLVQEQEFCNDEAMEEKLNHFQIELHYMEKQLGFLKADMEKQSALPITEYERILDVKSDAKTAVESDIKSNIIETPNKQAESQVKEQIKPAKKDLEKTIGKSLMGIVASVLIFISMILFATLLLPYFNDTAKMIAAYLVSFAFLGIGLWKLKKDKENKFYLALTGCGFGALYISLLLSNMYFKVIGDIALYVLIGIWAIGVCFLSKLKNPIFQLIGQLGIWISMIFGCSLCVDTGDTAKFIALVIFYFISSSIFYIVHFNREFSKNMIHHVFHALNFVILLNGCYDVIGEGGHVITILVFLFMALHVGVCFYCSCQNSNVSFGVFLGIYAFLALQVLTQILTNEDSYGVVAYFISMALILFLLMKSVKGSAGKNIAAAMLAGMAAFCLNLNSSWAEHGAVLMLIIPFLVLGFVKENTVLKYFGLFLFFIYSCGDGVSAWESLLLGSVVVVTAFVLLHKYKEQYTTCLKGFTHVFSVFFLYRTVQRFGFELTDNPVAGEICAYFVTGKSSSSYLYCQDAAEIIAYFLIVLFHVGMMKSCFSKNLKTGEKENPVLYNIINVIFMFMGLARLDFGVEGLGHFVVIITTIIAFMVNSKNLLEKKTHIGWGIYVGIKFTILLVAILASFDSANYVISIACFILAIICIVAGFFREYKSLRVFGLILSMISTFKLIMIDIYYTNTLGNAFSFFASGILCFAISLIYNLIDKKMKKEREEEEEEFVDKLAAENEKWD